MILPSQDVVRRYDGGRKHQCEVLWLRKINMWSSGKCHSCGSVKERMVAYMIYYVITVNHALFIY